MLVLLSDKPFSQMLVNVPRDLRASDDYMSRLKALGHPPSAAAVTSWHKEKGSPQGSGLIHCGNSANVVRKDFSFHVGCDPESRRKATKCSQ